VIVLFVENIFKLERGAIGELVGNKRLISIVIDLLIDFDVSMFMWLFQKAVIGSTLLLL